MSVRLPLVILGMLSAFAGLAPFASAADSKDKAIAYRWTDEQGVVHYGDRIPPQYAQRERAVLNSQGVEVRKLDAQRTPEQAAAEAVATQKALREKQRDAFLTSTYGSVKDIEVVRDIRLDQVQGQKYAAQQYVESLHARLGTLQTRARFFKPYSPRPGARRMPDDLAEDLVHTLNELRTQSNIVVAKDAEETALKAQFQADIDRFTQLHTAHN
jgi:Domain of unknown function (DUF4124)